MSFRHVLAIVAALLCTTAFAQSESPADAPAGDAEVTVTAAAEAAPAAVTAVAEAEVKPGSASAGKDKVMVCAACHGIDGNSMLAEYPRLAGQGEEYIARQLAAFKSGERVDAIMAGMAYPLSAQDMRDIGAYYATQKPQYGVADESLAAAGQALYRGGDGARSIPACMACHGPAGEGNAGAAYPHLAGQHEGYLRKALQGWKDGEAWGSGTYHQIMPLIASRLTDADINALSSYLQGLHPAK